LSGEEKQTFLEIDNLYDRMKFLVEYFSSFNKNILNQNNEEIMHRISLKNPDNNLNRNFSNSGSRSDNVIKEFEEKVSKIKLTEEAKKIALDEIERLKSSKNNPDYEWTINYLNNLLSLPWDSYTVDSDDIKKTVEILDRDHFGLDKVKKRIIEYLAVRKLVKVKKKENKISNINKIDNENLSLIKSGSILCLNGPPGVGKTSLAKSIADSLGKKFYRLSLGGLREVAEINGHRRTFVAAMPGMIIQALKRIQSKNPIILLDEIDKVGQNFKGDVSSSLLEVLDPEQNQCFKDHYLNTPFDLSQVFFICTSNYIENISPPLRDRMEIININGYSPLEKIEIGKKYLIPKQLKLNGLKSDLIEINVIFNDKILNEIILYFTFESGVRQLDRNIASICRNVARITLEDIEKNTNLIGNKNFVDSRGSNKIDDGLSNKENLKIDDISNNLINLDDNNKEITNENITQNKYIKEILINEKIIEEVLGKKRKEIDLELRINSPGVAIVN